MCFVYITMVLGQPAGLPEEAYLYASADWLSSSVSQRIVSGQQISMYESNGKCLSGGSIVRFCEIVRRKTCNVGFYSETRLTDILH